MSAPRFRDRVDAGRQLAGRMTDYAGRDDVVVLGLPRGGVPVAAEVATALAAPLDVFVVRKLGLPGHEELAMGAVGPGGVVVRNNDVLAAAGVSSDVFEAVRAGELAELERRERAYRGARPPLSCAGRTVVLVDDGLATGATMRVAVVALREHDPARIVVAIPVAARSSYAALKDEVDDVACVATPHGFTAVGAHYADFSPTTDDEVRAILDQRL